MTQHLDLHAIRQSLAEQRAAILERIRADEVKLRSRAETNIDPLDLAQDYVSRAQRSARLTQSRQQLEQVEAALWRLDEGTYGTCVECGEAIPPARLRVLPYARLCIRCQERQERKAVSH